MRLSPTILAVIAFLLAGVFSSLAARVAVGAVEERSVEAVQEQLATEGFAWASVLGDGLQVIIEGEAPTEADRFRAMSIAGGIVDASRVIDNMRVADTAGIAAPDFAIEILRNDSGVSLIGLIPATTDRDALGAQIARIAGGAEVTDLLQSADYPVPADWRPALDFALDALGRLPRSKISVAAGRVEITAISDSVNEQRRIEADLARSSPDNVTLALSVTAPRPVISPYTVRFAIDDRGPHFDACAADNEEQRDTILTAARAAGATGQLDCTLALGVPTRSWGEAVALGINALAELGGGSLTFSDADVVLVAAEGTAVPDFDRVVGELSNALPEVFTLEAVRPVSEAAGEQGPPEFTATLSPEGQAQIRGRVHDELMNETVANFARAQFGADRVTMGTRIASDGLPSGWSVRVLAGIEALSLLANGAVTVLPDSVTVTGQTGNATARDEIARLFIEKLGQDAQFAIDVAYVEALDPIAGLPTPEECVNQILVVTEGRKITFEPGSATLNADAVPIMDDIAEVLRLCGDLRLRISGFTDSQGRDEMNLSLSQDRAESVLDALRMRRVPVAAFEAVGYGEANPIADNETEEGREANRRIEFSLIVPEGVEQPTTLEGLEQPVAGQEPGVVPSATLTVTPVDVMPRPEDASAVMERPETRPRARTEERPDLSSVPQDEAASADGEEAVEAVAPADESTGAGPAPDVEAPEVTDETDGPVGEDVPAPAEGVATAEDVGPDGAPAEAVPAPDAEEVTAATVTEESEAAPAEAVVETAPETAPPVAPEGDEVAPATPATAEDGAGSAPVEDGGAAAADVPEAAPASVETPDAAEAATDPATEPPAAEAAAPEATADRSPVVNAMEAPPGKRPQVRPSGAGQ
jgi:OOP family OmpA-OmpF porin